MTLTDILIEALSQPVPEFSFEIGDKVRIKSTLQYNTEAIENILGKEGIVVGRRHVGLLRECWYEIKVGNRTESFRDGELDLRYGKR
jgi:uncharacterized protein YodC (DUF2158 family)